MRLIYTLLFLCIDGTWIVDFVTVMAQHVVCVLCCLLFTPVLMPVIVCSKRDREVRGRMRAKLIRTLGHALSKTYLNMQKHINPSSTAEHLLD